LHDTADLGGPREADPVVTGAVDRLAGLVNGLLAPAGVMVARAAPSQAESWRAEIGGRYRSDREVIALARRTGLSVSDYLERQWGNPGRRAGILARMQSAGALGPHMRTVCEIGPGSGGYIQDITRAFTPEWYEIYEIEAQRARWLGQEYPVTVRETEGEALSGTDDAAINLVHAHGVFASLKVISCFTYFDEISRVTAPGGHVCFDIIDDDCLSDDAITRYLAGPLRYLQFMSRQLVEAFFKARGFALVESFRTPLLVSGESTYLIFRKRDG
jgi:methyltransferase family protein